MESTSHKLLIAGFSGAGKSTVLRELAQVARADFKHFVDLDTVARGQFPDVASFVAQHGWESFRAEELRQLEVLLSGPETSAIALGGGSLETAWPLIGKYPNVRVCLLDVPFAVAWKRLELDPEVRPLASGGQEAMAALYLRRQGNYQRAHFSVLATQSPRQVALAILERIRVA